MQFARLDDTPTAWVCLAAVLQLFAYDYIDPPDTVNHILEAVIVDHHVIIRMEAKIDNERLLQQRKPAQLPDRVNSVGPISGDGDILISWDPA